MHTEEDLYLKPDYSSDEVPFDSGDDDEELDDIFPMEDDDEAELDEKLSEEQNKLNEQHMSNSPFQAPSWGTTGQQNTPFGTTAPTTFPWEKPAQTSSPWVPAGSRPQPPVQQPQMLVPTTAIRIERPKKYIIIDMFDGVIESWSSEGKPNVPPRAPYDVRLKFDVWQAIASFSPQFVYSIVPVMPSDQEAWNTTFRYITTSLSSYLRLPLRNCPAVTQGISGRRKDDIIKGILQFIPKEEINSVVYIGIYSGYYNLGNEDLIAAKHCNIEYADIYQLLKGEV